MTPEEAYWKAYRDGKRLPELEHIILVSPRFAYQYAFKIIKGRWIEAEDIIVTSPYHCYAYAEDIIKGKLPEKMHNMMLLHAIEDPNHLWTRQYFLFVNE